MDFAFITTIFLIGFIGSFISGMVGIGGSIIKYPLLLYIPPLFGIAAFSAHEVAGISAIQVFFASIAGVWAYRKGGFLNRKLIVTMGSSVLIGSFVGSYFSKFMHESGINLTYGILALLAVLLMFFPQKNNDETNTEEVKFNGILVFVLALIVGVGAGIVGAAGAFLLVPIMLVVLKIPTRMTIASSLAITFLSSIGAAIGKITTGQILFLPATIMIIASLIASPLGVKFGKKMDTKLLKWLLAGLIFATAVKIWFGILL